jgi:phospholipid/cholesterol/gamma-HCH transport system permease protein
LSSSRAFLPEACFALQSSATLSEFGATAVTGQFVSLTMIRELGAVLTGIMVSGRNASSMASELGSMVVTEQIDAMRALGVDPMRKLVTPRIFASIAMLLLLTIVADAFGILGGAAVTVFPEPPERHPVLSLGLRAPRYPDIIQGLVKPLFFGYILGSIGCFYGMRTTGGTEGVGRSTISAVVNSSVLIIFVDFLITHVLLSILPT